MKIEAVIGILSLVCVAGFVVGIMWAGLRQQAQAKIILKKADEQQKKSDEQLDRSQSQITKQAENTARWEAILTRVEALVEKFETRT